MAQLQVNAEDFSLTSTWYVTEDMYENFEISSGPTTAGKTITFGYSLPAGAKVTGAYIHAVWGYPNSGFYSRYINDVGAPTSGNTAIEIDPEATEVAVTFKFRANGSTTQGTGSHSGVSRLTEVYLMIEYELGGYIYRVVGGVLTPYQVFRAENGALVQYQLYHAENGELVRH